MYEVQKKPKLLRYAYICNTFYCLLCSFMFAISGRDIKESFGEAVLKGHYSHIVEHWGSHVPCIVPILIPALYIKII